MCDLGSTTNKSYYIISHYMSVMAPYPGNVVFPDLLVDVYYEIAYLNKCGEQLSLRTCCLQRKLITADNH